MKRLQRVVQAIPHGKAAVIAVLIWIALEALLPVEIFRTLGIQ